MISKESSSTVDSMHAPGDARVLPIIEEFVAVEKVQVDTGGFAVSKRIEAQEVTVDEPLQNYRVEIERRPLGTPLPAGEAPLARQEGDTWIIPVVEEVLVTEKRLVLVEEVRVTRVAGSHRKPQKVVLRREELIVERLDAGKFSTQESS